MRGLVEEVSRPCSEQDASLSDWLARLGLSIGGQVDALHIDQLLYPIINGQACKLLLKRRFVLRLVLMDTRAHGYLLSVLEYLSVSSFLRKGDIVIALVAAKLTRYGLSPLSLLDKERAYRKVFYCDVSAI